jgi:hypothetical protein
MNVEQCKQSRCVIERPRLRVVYGFLVFFVCYALQLMFSPWTTKPWRDQPGKGRRIGIGWSAVHNRCERSCWLAVVQS